MAILFPRGTILCISQVLDQRGVNPKDRHVVLLRDLDSSDIDLQGAAITGTFTYPLPATAVSLPFHRQGRCVTGLNKASVVDCTWIVTAAPEDILGRTGFTPSAKLVTILQQVENNLPPPPPATAES